MLGPLASKRHNGMSFAMARPARDAKTASRNIDGEEQLVIKTAAGRKREEAGGVWNPRLFLFFKGADLGSFGPEPLHTCIVSKGRMIL